MSEGVSGLDRVPVVPASYSIKCLPLHKSQTDPESLILIPLHSITHFPSPSYLPGLPVRSRSCHTMGMGRNPCTQFLHRPRPHQASTGQWLGTCSTPGSFETCRNVAAPGLGDCNPVTPSKSVSLLSLQEAAKAHPQNRCIHSFVHSFNRLS